MIGGQCICWGRQNLSQKPPPIEAKKRGMFFLALACHQLSQLVSIKGLPDYVTSYVHKLCLRKKIILIQTAELDQIGFSNFGPANESKVTFPSVIWL